MTDRLDFIEVARSRVRAATRLPPPAERRRIRQDCGLTIRELAEFMGTAHSSVFEWETGVREPTGERLVRYADALHSLQTILESDFNIRPVTIEGEQA